jgi:hypothetical protein
VDRGGGYENAGDRPSVLATLTSRNTSPEHAIFMLNRQTVKNVTIPLVPGEMKVTAVGAGMLQIARRGESMSPVLQILRTRGSIYGYVRCRRKERIAEHRTGPTLQEISPNDRLWLSWRCVAEAVERG